MPVEPRTPASAAAPAATPAAPPAATPAAARRPEAPADPLAGYRFTIVPHTHWDREWYLPFEVFRLRLSRAVEQMCNVLERDAGFRSFTLDGQAVILEDVVELRPDLEPRIRALLAAGRLVTGPSYVLPDEFLAGPEALVRNLLVGRQVCEAFGGRSMAVGYLPDTFGHVGQLPQILRGFGLDSFFFWRGLGDEAARVGLAFAWEAPDGSRVTAVRQLGSYGNGNQFGRWGAGGVDLGAAPDALPEGAIERLERYVEAFATELERTPTAELFLCNGSDHEGIHERLPEIVDHVRASRPATAVEIGSYEEYWDRLRPTIEPERLAVVAGELVGGRDAPVLRGINSARIRLKQESERTERALLVAETLAALGLLRHEAVPALDALDRAWREQLRNLPHDSISGCSIDEVERDMLVRFATARTLADRVSDEALAALARGTAAWSHAARRPAGAAVVNTLAWRRRLVVDLALPDSLLDAAGSLAAVTESDVLPVQVRDGTATIAIDVDGFVGRDVRLLAAAAGEPGSDAEAARSTGPATISNGILTVGAFPDGSLEITDERTGRRHVGLHRFEDVADRGDEYTFCPVEGDEPIGVVRRGSVRVTARGPVVAELAIDLVLDLPRRLAADRRRRIGRIGIPIRSVVRLVAGLDRVEVTTTLDNRARDHRLRLRFDASGAGHADPVRAEGHFDVVERPARPRWSGAGWTEPPAATHHTAGFVAAGDLAVIGRGLPEYEAIPRPGGMDLAMTLLRCVGWLSRDDLATRPGGAGPTLPTPGAQCQGPATFEYAIVVGAGAAGDNELLRRSADYRTPAVVGPIGAGDDEAGVLRLDGDVVATALKPAVDGSGAILRLVNAGPSAVPFAITGSFVATAVRLDETALPDPPSGDLASGEIRTVRLTWG